MGVGDASTRRTGFHGGHLLFSLFGDAVMKDVHDSSTFDWVETLCDNTQQNSEKLSQTEVNVKSENDCVTPLRTKEIK